MFKIKFKGSLLTSKHQWAPTTFKFELSFNLSSSDEFSLKFLELILLALASRVLLLCR